MKKFMGRKVLALFLAQSMVLSAGSFTMAAETEPVCGLDEHTHSEECYQQELICELEETQGHTHAEDCYNEDEELICELEETQGHTHSDSCYEKKLLCELREHTHSEACYTDPAAAVQEMIDALPAADEITADNAAEVEEQLAAIDEAEENLSDEAFAQLDTAAYEAAVAALEALGKSSGSAKGADETAYTFTNDVTLTGTITNAEAVYLVISDTTNENGDKTVLAGPTALTTGTSVPVCAATGNYDTYYYVIVFVKGNENHLVTGLGANGAGNIYAIDDDKELGGESKNVTPESIKNTLKEEGYVAKFGWTPIKSGAKSLTFEIVGQQPTPTVTIASSQEKAKPGDTVTLNVTITPAAKVNGRTLTAEVKSATIEVDGEAYEVTGLTTLDNGATWTGSISYKVTDKNYVKNTTRIPATAKTTIDYGYSMTAGDGHTTDITTTATITASDATTIGLTYVKVAYEYDGDVPADYVGQEPTGYETMPTGAVSVAGIGAEESMESPHIYGEYKYTFGGWKLYDAAAKSVTGNVLAKGSEVTAPSDGTNVLFKGTWTKKMHTEVQKVFVYKWMGTSTDDSSSRNDAYYIPIGILEIELPVAKSDYSGNGKNFYNQENYLEAVDAVFYANHTSNKSGWIGNSVISEYQNTATLAQLENCVPYWLTAEVGARNFNQSTVTANLSTYGYCWHLNLRTAGTTPPEVNLYNVIYTWSGLESVTFDKETAPTVPAGQSNAVENDSVTVDNTYTSTTTVKDASDSIYIFSGWTTNDATIADGRFTMPAKDVTLTGAWKTAYKVTYEITGDGPEGVTLPTDETAYAEGTTVTVADHLKSSGWRFNGWTAQDADGNTVSITGGTLTMPGADVIVTGTWTRNSSDHHSGGGSTTPTTPDPDDDDDNNNSGGDENPTDIPDEDTPLSPTPGAGDNNGNTATTDIPDDDTPMADTPGDTTDILDKDTPMSETSGESADTADAAVSTLAAAEASGHTAEAVDLADEDVPKANVPQTGDNQLALILAALLSGFGLAWLSLSGQRRKREENR